MKPLTKEELEIIDSAYFCEISESCDPDSVVKEWKPIWKKLENHGK